MRWCPHTGGHHVSAHQPAELPSPKPSSRFRVRSGSSQFSGHRSGIQSVKPRRICQLQRLGVKMSFSEFGISLLNWSFPIMTIVSIDQTGNGGQFQWHDSSKRLGLDSLLRGLHRDFLWRRPFPHPRGQSLAETPMHFSAALKHLRLTSWQCVSSSCSEGLSTSSSWA